MGSQYPGECEGGRFADLFTLAEAVDLGADAAYRVGGLLRLQWWLGTSDIAEHLLSRLGAEVALFKTGDVAAFQALLTSRPPGQSDITPEWALARARDHSKAVDTQRARAERGRKISGDGSTSPDENAGDGGSKPRRKAKGKERSSAGDAGAPEMTPVAGPSGGAKEDF